MSISLRAADDGDLPAVGALHCRSRRTAYAHILPAETLDSLSAEALGDWWTERRRWEGETHQLTVAEAGGRVVGFSYVGPSETDGATELYAIHVEPDLVGTGVGRLLMVDALERLAEMGGERAVLWVLEDNERARGFYDRGGWAADGTTRIEPVGGEPVPQLRYSRRL